ncbi:unnamed protein product, partial [Nesidiocoris tenuis]
AAPADADFLSGSTTLSLSHTSVIYQFNLTFNTIDTRGRIERAGKLPEGKIVSYSVSFVNAI